MLFDISQVGLEPGQAVALAALLIGIAFGILSESSQFCLLGGLREARHGQGRQRLAAFGVAALAALAFTQIAVGLGYADVTGSVYLSGATSVIAVIVGGLLFGLGAVLTRGCAGRLAVLAPTGNLRALVAIIVLGLMAYATMRGILAPLRLRIEAFGRWPAHSDALSAWGLASESSHVVIGVIGLIVAASLLPLAGARRGLAALGIGIVVTLGWIASTQLGDDGFEKIQPWSAAFVSPLGNGLVYLITYTGSKIDFGIAFIGGVLVGAFASAQLSRRVRLVTFESPRQTVRTLAGATLMGIGGVMALGCTTGQGLSGVSTLAPMSFAALASIAAGMWLGLAFETRRAAAMTGLAEASAS
jgi:uncharacterized membrane protein YedE/YeeE